MELPSCELAIDSATGSLPPDASSGLGVTNDHVHDDQVHAGGISVRWICCLHVDLNGESMRLVGSEAGGCCPVLGFSDVSLLA